MPDTAASPALTPEPSFEDALAFVREHAGDARLTSGELLVEHAAGTARIMQTLNVDPAAIVAAALLQLRRILTTPSVSSVNVLARKCKALSRMSASCGGWVRSVRGPLRQRCRKRAVKRKRRAVPKSKRCAKCCSRSRRIFAWC